MFDTRPGRMRDAWLPTQVIENGKPTQAPQAAKAASVGCRLASRGLQLVSDLSAYPFMRFGRSLSLICVVLICVSSVRLQAQVNTEAMRRLDVAQGWHNSLALSATYSSGNTDFVSLRTRFRSDYMHDVWHTFLVANLQQAENNGKSFTSKGFVHLRGIYAMHPRIMPEAFVQKQFNESLLLDDRNLIGAGFRIAVVVRGTSGKQGSARLYLGIGAMLENETLSQGDKPETTLVRSTNYVTGSWQLDERVGVSATSYFQPALREASDFRVLIEASLRFALTEQLAFNTRLNLRYDSDPPLELDDLDVELIQGVSYDF